MIRSPREAEIMAAEWLQYLGYADATVTATGADGGVDVIGKSVVAQVKAHMAPTGRADLQKLYGVASHLRRKPIFFSLVGYTQQALAWANDADIALFRFGENGIPEAINVGARGLTPDG
jgi:hypothetical protein